MSALNLEPVHDLSRAPGSLGGPAGTLPEGPAKRDRFVAAGHKPRGNPAGSAPLRGRLHRKARQTCSALRGAAQEDREQVLTLAAAFWTAGWRTDFERVAQNHVPRRQRTSPIRVQYPGAAAD